MKKTNSIPSIVSELNGDVENYLLDNKIRTRKAASPGLWLCFVLPSSVILGLVNHPDCSYFYRSASCLSVGLLLNSLSIIFQINHSTQFRTACCAINSITTTLLLNYFTDHSLIFNVILGIFSSFGFNKLLLITLQLSPETFTFGEVAVLVQAVIVFLASVVASVFMHTPVTCIDIATRILQVGVTAVMALCGGIYCFPQLRSPPQFFASLAIAVVVIVVLLHVVLGFSAILWIISLATEDFVAVKLIASWVVASVAAVVAAMTQVKGGRKASTTVRKYFHLLALVVYLPGLLFKPCLLYVASGIIFAIFVGLEMVRVAKISPVAPVLDSVFLVFADEKDNSLALTPLYLMAGVSAPLWLHPSPAAGTTSSLLPLMAGLLSIGVGDTAASVCGSWCGRHKWPDSQRTKEGSAACFISQLFFVIALIHFGYIPRNNLLQPIAAIFVVSLVEATTDQIDNLALPLLMYAMLL